MSIPTLMDQLQELGPYAHPVSKIIKAALDSVEPRRVVRSTLLGSQKLLLSGGFRLGLLSVGKAAIPMTLGALEVLADDISSGVVVPKHIAADTPVLPPRFFVQPGAHPTPDERSLIAGKTVLNYLSGLAAEDQVICLISGGGSSLMTLPVADVTLSDLQQLTRLLLGCGATITEINILRKHLDRIKGGGLALAATPAKLVTLILSDVIGNTLDVIASGPTTPDPSTYSQAYGILEKYGLLSDTPASIVAVLHQGMAGERPETLKPGDPVFRNITHTIIADNAVAVKAALDEAVSAGFDIGTLDTLLKGEARNAGSQLAFQTLKLLAQRNNNLPPLCLVMGGETTVTLRGNGMGGRNLELALAAVPILSGRERVALITLATDGEDGPTDAAGALVTGETMQKARRLQLDPADFLARHDSYTFFAQIGGLLKTGPTGTNVNDLVIICLY